MIKKINNDIQIKDIDLSLLRKILKNEKGIAQRLEKNHITYMKGAFCCQVPQTP